MAVIVGILLNTLLIAGMIFWLSRGGGAAWINTLNATSLSTCISLFVIMETAGGVLGIFIWAHVTGHTEPLEKSLGYLGIWFGFLGTHVLVNSGTQIGKRLTDGTYAEKKGAANAAVEKAKATLPDGMVTEIGAAVAAKMEGVTTKDHAAQPSVTVRTKGGEAEMRVADEASEEESEP